MASAAIFALKINTMKLRTAAVFILAGAIVQALSVCYSLYFSVSEGGFFNTGTILRFLSGAPLAGGFIMLGAFLLRGWDTRRLTLPAILILCGSALGLVQSAIEAREVLEHVDSKAVYVVNTFVPQLSSLLFAIGIISRNLRLAAWSLLLGNIIALLALPQFFLYVLSSYGEDYMEAAQYFFQFTAVFSCIGDIGCIMLVGNMETMLRGTDNAAFRPGEEEEFSGISINGDLLDADVKPAETAEKSAAAEEYSTPLWWMVTFGLAWMPVIGLIFTVYFAIAKSQVKRGNWAVATVLAALLNSLLYIFLFAGRIAEEFSSKELGIVLIIVIAGLGSLATICSSINRRNQDDITLDTHAYGPTVTGWIGYMLLVILPLVNLICLIVFAADSFDKYRSKWAQARLMWIPLSFYSYLIYSDMLLDLVRLMR
jgi:hypothetical protein